MLIANVDLKIGYSKMKRKSSCARFIFPKARLYRVSSKECATLLEWLP